MEKLSTEKTEKLLKHLAAVIILYKKVAEDKKVNLEDLPAAIEFGKKLPEIIADVKEFNEIVAEFKDIDVTEIITLISKVDALVKEIEAA